MFTGIVAAVGEILACERVGEGARLRVAAPFAEDLELGESVAVNGCCLTVVECGSSSFTADLSAETLARTSLGSLPPGHAVNLERSLRPMDRLGGHIVQGHVDAVGVVSRLEPTADGGADLRVDLPRGLRRYVALKGSIAVNGISLTIASIEDRTLSFAIVPHTLRATSLRSMRAQDPVNIEVDLLARYLESLAIAGEA